jgi:hypothetical protein
VANSDFAVFLQGVLETRQLSKRRVARLLAGEDATDKQLDIARGQLSGWLAATVPHDASAIRLARALGEDENEFVTKARTARRRQELRQLAEQVGAVDERVRAIEAHLFPDDLEADGP